MGHHLGNTLSYYLMMPFALLLLAIAILPLTVGHWFEQNRNRALVAGLFGLPVLAYLVIGHGHQGWELVLHTAEEYISFIVLLAALFTISGGIYLTGNLLGTPLTNLAFLLVGAVLANFIGTTGAAMVLIRPLLRANDRRAHKRHIVIFAVFVVCNIGGLLTPLGDPPLFLGFLRGVSFFWTLGLLPQWALAVGLTCTVFLVLEYRAYGRETPEAVKADVSDYVPLGIQGKVNILFLLGVIGSVLLSKPLSHVGEALGFPFLRELLMATMMILSLKVGPSAPRQANQFSWGPIQEVAIIFAGIFSAMIPALAILEAKGGHLGLSQPWHFFWATGVLSSFLDNAPTYLTFTSTAQGYLSLDTVAGLMSDQVLPHIGLSPERFLAAISCGAVFMGANSYIGNAPNFMVKAIAEENQVPMPSFFGYMGYSGVVLVPIFIAVTLVFFR